MDLAPEPPCHGGLPRSVPEIGPPDPVIAHDMAGDGVMARDWVFDGRQVWEVMAVNADGSLRCRDPNRLSAEQVPHRLTPGAVAKVRADRVDDQAYLRAVFEQAEVLRDFWSDDR